MDHTALMRVMYRLGHCGHEGGDFSLTHPLRRAFLRSPLASHQRRGQTPTLGQAHAEESDTSILADFVDGEDMGMLQARDRFNLVAKAVHCPGRIQIGSM